MKKVWILIVILLLCGVAFYFKQHSTFTQTTGIASVNGRLELSRLDIATLSPGRVEEIYINEGEDVAQGARLARLSSSHIQSQVDASLAQIQAAQAQIDSTKAQKQRATETVSRAIAEIKAQQQQLTVAKLEFDNARKLRRDNLISISELERREASYKAAQAAVESVKAVRSEAEVAVAQAQAAIFQAQAMLEKAEADSSGAQSQQEDMLIRAPKAGRVEYKIAEIGSVLGAGGRVVSLLDLSNIYLNLFLPAHQSNLVRINDEARIKIDGSDYVLPARVSYVASNAQFTPKSVETSEERAKLMFKIKLQIPEEIAKRYSSLLKGGMTAVGYVKYDSQAEWGEDLQVKLPNE
ncbi:HlyD family secretion protein [Pasteurellaceae bacterium 15-036681]|nr:HlyD family secretion protein [Pasteurellaceae bacterium 15-036681]